MRQSMTINGTVSLPGVFVSALAALALVGAVACSGDGGDQECSEDNDCGEGESCVENECQSEESNGENNEQDEPESEDYYISYIRTNVDGDASDLMAYSTADEEHVQVSPSGLSCEYGCWLSDDLQSMVWAEPNEEDGQDVFKMELNDELKAASDASEEELATGVSSITFDGQVLSYQRDVDGQADAFYMDINEGEESRLGPLEDGSHTSSWHIDSESEQVMVYEPADRELNLSFGELGETISGQHDVTIEARHYQQSGGSYYSRSMPAAFSSDGDIAAFVTEAPVEYGACESDDDCSGPGQSCGPDDTCTVMQNTINFLDTNELDELGAACGGPGTCSSDVHECYMPDGEEETATATCRPRPVSAGLPNVGSQDGCAETEGNEDYHYTLLHGPAGFDDADNLYLVGERNCDDVGGGEVPHTDVIRVDPLEGEHEVVWGNTEGGDLDLNDCWDSEAGEPSDDECQPYISSARLSPEHNELAVEAMNPYVDNVGFAEDTPGLWTVLRNGEEHAWAEAEQSSDQLVEDVNVHPMP